MGVTRSVLTHLEDQRRIQQPHRKCRRRPAREGEERRKKGKISNVVYFRTFLVGHRLRAFALVFDVELLAAQFHLLYAFSNPRRFVRDPRENGELYGEDEMFDDERGDESVGPVCEALQARPKDDCEIRKFRVFLEF